MPRVQPLCWTNVYLLVSRFCKGKLPEKFLIMSSDHRSPAKVVQLCLTLETRWTVARQAPLSIVFSRQEYWSGLPFPSPIVTTSKMQFSPSITVNVHFSEIGSL